MAVINNLPQSGGTYDTFQTRVSNVTIGASTYDTRQIDIEKSGYTAVALAGYYTENSASGGANTSFCVFSSVFINTTPTTCFCRIRNLTNAAAKVDIVLNVLYRKD